MKRLTLLAWMAATCLCTMQAQDLKSQKWNEKTWRYQQTDKVIHAELPDIGKVWKKGMVRFITIPESGGLKLYIRLHDLISGKNAAYTPKNTLLICTEKSLHYVKEVSERMPVYVNTYKGFYSEDGKLLEGSIAPQEKKGDGDTFVFTLEQEL